MSFKDRLINSLDWWLGKRNKFIINDEYSLELLFIDKVNNSAKIRITNIKTNKVNNFDMNTNVLGDEDGQKRIS